MQRGAGLIEFVRARRFNVRAQAGEFRKPMVDGRLPLFIKTAWIGRWTAVVRAKMLDGTS
jgi:hypothetical protein